MALSFRIERIRPKFGRELWHPSFVGLHFLMKDNKRLTLRLSGLKLLVANTKWDSTARASRSHALRGNAYRKALPSICESRSPYDPHVCICPTTEAEPLRTHSQAEPGNERFSTLSRLMSMAELLEVIRKDFIAKNVNYFYYEMKDARTLTNYFLPSPKLLFHGIVPL